LYRYVADNYHYAMPIHDKNLTAVGHDSVNKYASYAHDYLNRLYLPTHARFGPIVLGALLAFMLPSPAAAAAAKTKANSVAWWKHAARWWAHVTALGVLCMALMPPPPPGEADSVPPEAHAFMTTALRNMFATATAVLLYSALVPRGYAMHSRWLRGFLSWSGFAPVARLSYAINMVHFRVLMELAYLSPRQFKYTLAKLLVWAKGGPAAVSAAGAAGAAGIAPVPAGFVAVAALYVVGMAASVLLAWVFTSVIDGNLRWLLEKVLVSWWAPARRSGAAATRGKKTN
jgi:peptidoglycan/LPS O-acetylase OafA/YrhL